MVADYTDYRSNPPGNNNVDVPPSSFRVGLESNMYAEDYTCRFSKTGDG